VVLVCLYGTSGILMVWDVLGIARLVQNVYRAKIEMKEREAYELDPNAKVSHACVVETSRDLCAWICSGSLS
jgi:hypothetical protein